MGGWRGGGGGGGPPRDPERLDRVCQGGRPDVALPDIQFLFRAAPGGAGPWLAPFKPAFADGFSLRAVMLRPESRGAVTLASADPRTPVHIRQNFLATDSDRRTIRDGLRLARRIVGAAPLDGFAASELAPGADKQSDADLDAYIRATAAQPRTTRSAPAGWARRATGWRWSTRNCGSTVSRVCASSTPR